MKQVEVYTQPDCPPCQIVKKFLRHYSVPYTEYNIKTDSTAQNRLVHDYNSYSTPTVIVDGEAVIGFDIERLQQLLDIEQ
ncbi:glutaredoxin domain-containing protein [Ectobacillus panaciterrae]|uniref:glutaredoxin domain-containing protein n=1 Tax=Ectobacillus panaciterrae TaxID=363872 RepID=UPI0004081F47|nr:glutaredoxin domain-containing protein [Ectobacillus panaciterrae]